MVLDGFVIVLMWDGLLGCKPDDALTDTCTVCVYNHDVCGVSSQLSCRQACPVTVRFVRQPGGWPVGCLRARLQPGQHQRNRRLLLPWTAHKAARVTASLLMFTLQCC
jgi:hypothetical protein